YPEPLWKYEPISESILRSVVAKSTPWKATRSGTFPNSVYKFCIELLAGPLCVIFRALDSLGHEPADWRVTETIAGGKPGKDYSNPGAH
ncbi:hypothetical protein R3P38DRAFT_3573513, partial [Favolaschia claudopus]